MNSIMKYCLDEFYEVYKNDYFYELPSCIHDTIDTIQINIVPITSDENNSKNNSSFGEKRTQRGGRNRNHERAKKDTWREPLPVFTPTVIVDKKGYMIFVFP